LQALGFVHGAKIVHAPEAIHGRLRQGLEFMLIKFASTAAEFLLFLQFMHDLTLLFIVSVKLSMMDATSLIVSHQVETLASRLVYHLSHPLPFVFHFSLQFPYELLNALNLLVLFSGSEVSFTCNRIWFST